MWDDSFFIRKNINWSIQIILKIICVFDWDLYYIKILLMLYAKELKKNLEEHGDALE